MCTELNTEDNLRQLKSMAGISIRYLFHQSQYRRNTDVKI